MNHLHLPIALPRLGRATVVSVTADELRVRSSRYGEVSAHNAVPGWCPEPGERVLTVDDDGAEIFVIGVLGPPAGVASPVRVERTVEGARLTVEGGELEIAAERVRIAGAEGVELESERRVAAQVAGGEGEARSKLALEGDAAELSGGVVSARAGRLALLAEEITAAAERADAHLSRLRARVGRSEIDADDIVERARSVIRVSSGLTQIEAGRLRWVSKDSLVALCRRAKLKASAVFAIDGDSIHLG